MEHTSGARRRNQDQLHPATHVGGQACLQEHQGAAGGVLVSRAGDLTAISTATALWGFFLQEKKENKTAPPIASPPQCHRPLSISTSTRSGQTAAAPTPLACSVCTRTPNFPLAEERGRRWEITPALFRPLERGFGFLAKCPALGYFFTWEEIQASLAVKKYSICHSPSPGPPGSSKEHLPNLVT